METPGMKGKHPAQRDDLYDTSILSQALS
jgi:hypothetical protein